MREFRTVYSAPYSADRLCKPSYVYRCIYIRVPLGSARTREAMPLSFSYIPTSATRLRRVCGIDECDLHSDSFSFVFNKILKLSESPTMQASSNFYSSFNVCSNIRQIFHPNFGNAMFQGFRDNGLANNVVHMLNVSLLSPRDFAQFSFCCTTTVGLKSATMREMHISLMPELFASKDLSGASCCQVVFPNIHTHYLIQSKGCRIGDIEKKVEIPNTFSKNKPSFFCVSSTEKSLLECSTKKIRFNSSGKCKERSLKILNRVSSFVEINGLAIKSNTRKRLIFLDSAIAVQRLVGIGNAMHSLTSHLTSKVWECFSNLVVNHVMQGNTIPTSLPLGNWSNRVAGGGELFRQSLQRLGLLRGRGKFEGDGSLHIGHSNPILSALQARSTPFLPMPEGRGFLELSR